MKALVGGLALLVLVGCTKLDEPEPAADNAAPSAPAGPTPVMQQFMPPQVDSVVQNPGGNRQPAPAPPGPPPDNRGIIGKMTAEIVNYRPAMAENPRLKVVENKAEGNDPLSFAATAYVSARSRATVLNFTHQLDILRALKPDGGPISFEELQKLMQQTGLRLSELYPYQMYAYDEQTGAILILEDPDDKARRYREAGIPLDE